MSRSVSTGGSGSVLPKGAAEFLKRRMADEQVRIAREHLQRDCSGPSAIPGVSPHAPYTVHPDLFSSVVRVAARHSAPLAVHLAETREELELLAHGTGPLTDMLREVGAWEDHAIPRATRPLDYLRQLAHTTPVLIVHGNYLDEEEIAFVASAGNLTVVYCPRTHACFGHDEHPWRKLVAAGARVALGTDSRASSPDLSLWREMLFLRERFPDIDPRLLLRLGTLNGAEALGLEQCTGTLHCGRSADLTIVRVPDPNMADPFAALFDSRSRVIGCMRSGQWLARPCCNLQSNG